MMRFGSALEDIAFGELALPVKIDGFAETFKASFLMHAPSSVLKVRLAKAILAYEEEGAFEDLTTCST